MAAGLMAEDGHCAWWDSAGKITAAYLTGLGHLAGPEHGFEDRVIALLLDSNQRILAVLDGVDESFLLIGAESWEATRFLRLHALTDLVDDGRQVS